MERARAGLSQAALSALVGITPTGLAKIERGESDPRLSTIHNICKALGLAIAIAPDATATAQRFSAE